MAAGERRNRILDLLVGNGETTLETKWLCSVCAEVTQMSGAGIMFMSGDVSQGSLCTTNKVSALLEELQCELGEGPCVDAHNQDRPILEPDLAHPCTPRWFAFTGPAVEAGAQAVFGFPLQVGAVRLGALTLYRDHSGEITDDQHADALAMADVAAQAILVLQANAPPGKVASELLAGADFHFAVHQASGMIAAQLGVSVGQALVRLRAHAFGNERPLNQVAKDVVSRKLRFDSRSGEKDLGT